ncbi:hypothetical protein B0T13DRAFT_106417 [Neurospora crassa]|nr:hypothetical protein B0T13DRAFT_106417 [Neurospora crassa]
MLANGSAFPRVFFLSLLLLRVLSLPDELVIERDEAKNHIRKGESRQGSRTQQHHLTRRPRHLKLRTRSANRGSRNSRRGLTLLSGTSKTLGAVPSSRPRYITGHYSYMSRPQSGIRMARNWTRCS